MMNTFMMHPSRSTDDCKLFVVMWLQFDVQRCSWLLTCFLSVFHKAGDGAVVEAVAEKWASLSYIPNALPLLPAGITTGVTEQRLFSCAVLAAGLGRQLGRSAVLRCHGPARAVASSSSAVQTQPHLQVEEVQNVQNRIVIGNWEG